MPLIAWIALATVNSELSLAWLRYSLWAPVVWAFPSLSSSKVVVSLLLGVRFQGFCITVHSLVWEISQNSFWGPHISSTYNRLGGRVYLEIWKYIKISTGINMQIQLIFPLQLFKNPLAPASWYLMICMHVTRQIDRSTHLLCLLYVCCSLSNELLLFRGHEVHTQACNVLLIIVNDLLHVWNKNNSVV